jgi:hypothetical protein
MAIPKVYPPALPSGTMSGDGVTRQSYPGIPTVPTSGVQMRPYSLAALPIENPKEPVVPEPSTGTPVNTERSPFTRIELLGPRGGTLRTDGSIKLPDGTIWYYWKDGDYTQGQGDASGGQEVTTPGTGGITSGTGLLLVILAGAALFYFSQRG